MTGKHHIIASTDAGACIITSALSNNYHNIPVLIGTVGTTALGGLFPDIDSKTSKLGSKFKITSTIISKLFGHRGFLHSPIFAVAMFFLLRWVFVKNNIADYSLLYYGFVFGILNHFFCDMATKGGIPLLYPFQKVKFSISPMKSGSKYEIGVVIFISLIIVAITFLCIAKEIFIV